MRNIVMIFLAGIAVTGAFVLLIGPGGIGFMALAPLLIGAALTADRNTLTIVKPELKGYKVLNNTTIYKGNMVACNAAGWLVPATATAALHVVGVADEQVVSPSTDAAGTKKCRVRSGAFFDFNGVTLTQAMLGTIMYITDDNTFTAVAGTSTKCGILVEFISATRGIIYMAPGGAVPIA